MMKMKRFPQTTMVVVFLAPLTRVITNYTMQTTWEILLHLMILTTALKQKSESVQQSHKLPEKDPMFRHQHTPEVNRLFETLMMS